jgi:hypothetical protein
MELIQLKMPPDKLAAVIVALERDIDTTDPGRDTTELQGILNWMRYRLTRWNASHPSTPAA